MAKIIEISNDVVSVGTDNGSIKEVRMMDLNFNPVVGDEVEIFETETKTVISKKETKQDNAANGGVNINVSNSNNAPVYVANGTKAVNKVIYCILAFFLGGIGVHKFYAGKIGTGILFLCFSWTFIPALIAFIEFVIAIFKPADTNGNILV